MTKYTSMTYNVSDALVIDELVQYSKHDAVLIQRTICQLHKFQCIDRLDECKLLYNLYWINC